MAITNNHIQLFRNSQVFADREAAITRLGKFTSETIQDGTPVLARYNDGSVVKTLLALFYVNDSTIRYDIIGDSADINSAIAALETKLVGGASEGYKNFKAIEDKIKGDIKWVTIQYEGSVAKAVKDAVEALDVAEIKEAGKAIVSVSETGGKVSATTGDIDATHVIQDAAVTGEGAKPAVTVKTAIDNLRSTVAANKVVAEDASVVLGTKGGKTSLKVGVDADEKVLSANGALKTTIKLVEITDGLDANTAKAYQLQGIGNAPLGAQINIPKDSSLNKVYLGTTGDTVNEDTGVVTSGESNDPQSLNFVYHLETGKYSIAKVDVSRFLSESEFKDGLVVADHVVKVKVADDSEAFLTVGADGVKLSGVQAAINEAKASATTVVDAAANTHISVSESTEADGHKKFTVSDNVNGQNVKLDGYATTVSGDPAATDSVNDAISKLFNSITTNGTSAADTATKLENAKTAIGLNEDGTHKASNGHYTNGADTIEGEIVALDAHVKTNADTIARNKVVAGNGINVAEATEAGTTVSAKINTESGLAFNADTKAIEIHSIDAGTYN